MIIKAQEKKSIDGMTGGKIDGKMDGIYFRTYGHPLMKWRLYKEKLLWLRLNQGWSQEEAAQRCGAPDKKTYHLWETGKIERPQSRNLKKITQGFQMESVDEIILKPTSAPTVELTSLYNAHFNLRNVVQLPTASGFSKKKHTYKLVCFDMDATLIHGLELSSGAIWDALGDESRHHRKQGLRSYYTGTFSYEQWCLWVVDTYKQKGLTLEQLRKIINQYYLAPYLYDGLQQLKDHGCKLAIISGGVGTFLEVLSPDWSQYFDYLFVNQLVFSDNGCVHSVVPSPYGIDKKVEAIHYLCEKESIGMDEVVFVGSSFVNRQVAFNVGLTIGYANPSSEIRTVFDEIVKDDDFRNVVKIILR